MRTSLNCLCVGFNVYPQSGPTILFLAEITKKMGVHANSYLCRVATVKVSPYIIIVQIIFFGPLEAFSSF